MQRRESWVRVPEGSPFPAANLPYGVFVTADGQGRVGVAIGDQVLDAGAVARVTRAPFADLLSEASLNPLMAAGPGAWREVRDALIGWLTDRTRAPVVQTHLHPLDRVDLRLPFDVADYVDFYASEHHAVNAGRILRPGTEPLAPQWKHLPVGYHGRSGTVVVSGTPVPRPDGQRKPTAGGGPSFGPTEMLDIEAEVGFVVGAGSPRGRPVAVDEFAEHVFGVCLVNDWSARDIQAWEYVPLGPFLGKSFMTSVSAWVVPLAALEAARVAPPPRSPLPLPHLRDGDSPWGLDITLEVWINGHLVTSPPFSTTYWTGAQQLAHMTSNGASSRTGDLFASGTVSGPRRDQVGSLMELSWGGAEPFTTPDGVARTYLRDGDEVIITATAPAVGGGRLGFGEVRGTVE